MILDDKIEIKIGTKTHKHYTERGYKIKIGEKVLVKVVDLTKGSHVVIKVKCDVCGKEKEISHRQYYNNYNKHKIYCCSNKCAIVKNELTSIEKYGVDHYSKTSEFKEKMIESNLLKFNKEFYTQTEEYKEIMSDYWKNNNYSIQNKKRSDTNKQKFGTTFYQHSEDYLLKKDDIIKKYKITITDKLIEKYDNLIETDNFNFKFKCKNGHIFEIDRNMLKNRLKYNTIICTECNPNNSRSGQEKIILDFIKENYSSEIITNSRNVITPYELDIYLPKLNLAFEFNGLYWHNELHRKNDYHKMKSDLCEEKGIQLIHIWEDDWQYKQNIIKSMILNKLGKTHHKIYARKTEVREMYDNKLVRDFLNMNHIQGFVGSSVKLGLFYDDELVSLMTFGKQRKIMIAKSKETNFELLRFCNKLNTNVIGGASKLFKYFIRNYTFEEIITYADRSYSNGNLYKQLDFDFSHKTIPNYYYVIDGIKHHRFNFRKDKLIKEGYDLNKSEHQIMLDRKIYRIFNAGNYKFIFLV